MSSPVTLSHEQPQRAHTAPLGTQPGTPVTLQPQPTLFQSSHEQPQLTSQPRLLTPAPNSGTPVTLKSQPSHVAAPAITRAAAPAPSKPHSRRSPDITSQPTRVVTLTLSSRSLLPFAVPFTSRLIHVAAPDITSQPSHTSSRASRHDHHFEQQPAPFRRGPISRRNPAHFTAPAIT